MLAEIKPRMSSDEVILYLRLYPKDECGVYDGDTVDNGNNLERI